MRNLEIKCRVDNLDSVRRRALSAGGQPIHVLRQTDTYFQVERGLLKLREIEGHQSELIAYERPGSEGSRVSDYVIHTTDDATNLKEVLARSHAVLVTVRKSRELIMIEKTRVHLDTVEELGTFVELETAGTDRSDDEVRDEHERVMRALGLSAADGLASGYAAMLGVSVAG